MINGNFTEFIDQLYYGQELVFTYEGRKYFIQGWWTDNVATMVLDDVTVPGEKDYLWEYHADTMRECAEVFLIAPIWDGKDFTQIQENVTWSDW